MNPGTAVYILMICALAAGFGSGCATHELKSSFRDYSEIYAEAQNNQLLLNLARLKHQHPSYFFQLGQISATYRYDSSAGFGARERDSAPFPWIWNASASTGRSETPTFTFVPLAGGEFAARLLTPVRADNFHALLREGFPVDTLLRAVAQQIRFSVPGKSEVVLFNLPTSENKTNYATFLRTCDALRRLQERGYLANRNYSRIEAVSGGEQDADPTDKQVLAALERDLVWRKDELTGKWRLTRQRPNSLSVQLVPGAEGYLTELQEDEFYREFQEGELIPNLKIILDPKSNDASSTVQFRSFLFVLAQLAQEEEAFAELLKDPDFVRRVPPSQRRPVLRLEWKEEKAALLPPLARVSYQGHDYEIRDKQGEKSKPNQSAFLLAATLLTQLNIDPARISYQQQLLQVK